MKSEIRLFTRNSVAKAKEVVENPDEPADPEGGGRFADYAILTLNALRIELGRSYRGTIDLLSEMPGVLAEIGLTRLPHYTTLRDRFEEMPMKTWRAFLDARSRNAPAMLLLTQQDSIVISRAATTQIAHTTVYGH